MEKIWLAQYPPGVPADVDVASYPSLTAMLEHSCARFAALPACSNMGVTLSYADLDRLSRAFASYLQHATGLRKGDRLALMLPNILQYPVALIGALRAGLTIVNVNPLYTPRELEHQLCDSGARAIVVLENVAHTLEQVLPKTALESVITTQLGDLFGAPKALFVNAAVKYWKHMVPHWHIAGAVSFRDALRRGEDRDYEPVRSEPDDLALLQYTGGTTGVAKGVMLSHGNLVANVEQLGTWISTNMQQGEEVAVIPLPLYHIYALTSWLVFNKIGAHSLLLTNPRDLPAFVELLRDARPTAMIGVNTLYRALLDAPGFARLDCRRLKLTAAGGMAVQRAVAQRWKSVTGIPLVEGYGLSETSPVVISNRVDIDEWTGCIGLPLPSTEAAVLDEAGVAVAPGEVGEICVRGPQVMKGYWKRPDETKRVMTSDGFLRTGDMGVMDDRGFFRITDRKKDMIIVSGFKVFPNEIEDVVMLHADVVEVGAVGVPSEKSGEAIKLVVVKRNPELTEQALIEHCQKHLTAYKVPRIVEFRREPLPKSTIGKVLRRELRVSASVRVSAP